MEPDDPDSPAVAPLFTSEQRRCARQCTMADDRYGGRIRESHLDRRGAGNLSRLSHGRSDNDHGGDRRRRRVAVSALRTAVGRERLTAVARYATWVVDHHHLDRDSDK
jgi:hypothetical protein